MTTSTGVAVEIHRLSKHYHDGPTGRRLVALHGIDATITTSGTVGIIGANGAGKSTLLKVIAGVTRPTDGMVRRRGRVASVIELGLGFHPDLTGLDNIGFAAALHGLGRRRRREQLEAIVDFADLGSAIERPVRQYSSGMLARLGFAVATHVDAELVLVDEVLAVGDESFRARCLQRMDELRRSGATMLLVSHDLYLVDLLCDRALLLEEGRLLADGPTRDVVGAYAGGATVAEVLEGDAVHILTARLATPSIRPGDPVVLQVDIEVRQPRPGATASFAVEVLGPSTPGSSAEPTAAAAAELPDADAWLQRPGRWRVRVGFDAFPSTGGRYHARFSIRDPDGAPLAEVRDRLEVRGPIAAKPMLAVPVAWEVEEAGGR